MAAGPVSYLSLEEYLRHKRQAKISGGTPAYAILNLGATLIATVAPLFPPIPGAAV